MIQIKNLNVTLGNFIMKNINLKINTGEYFVLLGPTGCGKTVLLECLVGIRKPDSGEIWIDNENITHKYPEERHIGYLPQDFTLFPNMTVQENIEFGLKAQKKDKKYIQSVINMLAESLNLSQLLSRYTQGLSGGEKQRVALARALAIEPKSIFLDEPLNAIDENTRERLSYELRSIHDKFGTTFVHVSHNLEEISDVADRVGIMNFGTLEQVDTIQEILRHPVNQYVAEFTRTKNIFPGSSISTDDGCRVLVNNTIWFHTKSKLVGNVLAIIRPEEIHFNKRHLNPSELDKNVFSGKIVKITNKGNFIRLEIDIGILLTVCTMAYIMYADTGVQKEDTVSVYIPPDAVHLIKKI
ncbi:MAG: ABC transporter ATP-binding protein [Candidatus Hydrogenedentota bacterium]